MDDDRLFRSIEVKEPEEEDGVVEPETDPEITDEDAELEEETIDPFGDKWEQ